jgi:hypothetical protein
MGQTKREVVLRILDDQNRLVERADTKAISLLSTLGIFTVFFIAHFSEIPIDLFSIILLCIYFVSILLSILFIILAISPRIRTKVHRKKKGFFEESAYNPTFFGTISEFPDTESYKKSIDNLFEDETALTDTYIQQVYAVSKINDTKYKYVRRSVILVIITLGCQLALIAYTFTELRIS